MALAVPTYDRNVVRESSLSPGRITQPDMPDVVGQQNQQVARGLQQTGGVMAAISNDIEQQANQLRVDDALNRVKENALRLTYDKDAGYQSLKGINALERPNGKALPDEYAENLQKHIDETYASLGNDAQRAAFKLRSNDILTSFRGGIQQHEANEFKTYGLSVSDGVQATALREIGLNWKNPDAVSSAVERIRAETYRQAQFLGKSAEWQDAQARKVTSNAHKTALLSALEQNDAAYADSYLKKFSDQMDADDILSVRGHITKAMDAQVGFAAASEVVGKMAPRIQTSEAERAFNVALGTESNNRQFGADGKPLTSPKGAIGIAQVMPGTAPEAAKLAGLEWDEQRYKTDANYNKALGLAYFQKQLQTNGGDLAKAYAAYNAGPGALQDAIKKAERAAALNKNDPNVPARPWLDFMPKETRDYVAKNMKEFEAGSGQPARPTFAEIDNQLRNDPRLAGNPGRYKAAREEAERQFNEQTKAIKQQEEEAVATAMRGIIQNGGRFSDLPVAVRAAVPPKEVDNLIGFAQKISKGDDSTSLWLYNKLASNPDGLARMSDNEFFALRRELSEADFKHFSNERAKLNGTAPGSNGHGELNTQAIKQTIDERMRVMGIDPTPKDDGGKESQRVGGIRKFVNDYFLAAQREAGKKFSDAEVTQHIDGLFAKNTTFRGWFSTSSGPMLGMKAGDIPGTERDAIKSAFKRQGIDNPTDAQVLDIYWKRQLARK